MQGDEAFNGLQEDTDAQSKKEDAIEKDTKQLCTLPAKRETLRRVAFLRNLAMGLNLSTRTNVQAVAERTFNATRAITNPTRSFN